MASNGDNIAAGYRRRRRRYGRQEQRLAVGDRILTHARVAVFLITVLLFFAVWISGVSRWWYLAGGLAAAGFVALVTVHDALSRRMQRARLLKEINQQCLARLRRRWDDLPLTEARVAPSQQALATDLDLLGHASLFHFVCCAGTPIGIRVLRDWLTEPAEPEEIRLRQTAVAQLAGEPELREEFLLAGRSLASRASERFVDWADGELWLQQRPWLKWASRLLPALGLLALTLTLTGLLSPDAGGAAVLAVLAVNVVISVLLSGAAHDVFTQINTRENEVRHYVQMFTLMYQLPAATSKLDEIKREATERGGGVLLRMRQLHMLMALANISHSAMLFIFVYLPLQAILLYDFHVLYLLERWQQAYGRHARYWFEALGQFEALASLAMVAHDHPDWVFPDVDPAADRLDAEGIGHPLLPDKVRVVNDVSVGPAGTFLLVTGSNMSGKSTLLRAIGVNVVLGQAGGPVCARQLRLPPVRLATSMRIRDSLEDGVSFFMAELMRLKEIVDQAAQSAGQPEHRLLYLLDEILQGTNSKERHIAVVRVLAHLLKHQALGAISTHDLELATSEPLTDCCRAVHFRETLHDHDARQPMTFDYKLRPGVATTTNALRLLELVGLGDGPA